MGNRIREALNPLICNGEGRATKTIQQGLLALTLSFLAGAAFNPEYNFNQEVLLIGGAVITFAGSDFFKHVHEDQGGELSHALDGRHHRQALRIWWERTHITNKFWINVGTLGLLGVNALAERASPGTGISNLMRAVSESVIALRLSWNVVIAISYGNFAQNIRTGRLDFGRLRGSNRHFND